MAGQNLACATRSLFRACAKNALWPRALELLFQLQSSSLRLSTWNFNITITACAKGARWTQALGVLASLSTTAFRPCLVSFNATMAACQQGHAWTAVLDLFASILLARLRPDNISLGFAINACRASHEWQQSLEILRLYPVYIDTQYSQAVAALNAAISTCEKSRKWEHALAVLENMRRQGPRPDTITFNAAITACEKGQHWERSIQIFAQLQKSNLNPDTISFNAAISSCDKGQQWSRALHLLSEMRHFMHSPTVVTCTAIVTVLGRSQQAPLAASCLEDMRNDNVEPTSILYGAILGACMAGQDWELALAMLRSMQSDQVIPDPLCLSSAVSALVLPGRFKHFHTLRKTICQYAMTWLRKSQPRDTSIQRRSGGDPTDYDALLVVGLDLFPSLGENQSIVIRTVCQRRLLRRFLLLLSKLCVSDCDVLGSGALQRPFSLGSQLTAQALEHLHMETSDDYVDIQARSNLAEFIMSDAMHAGHSYSIRSSNTAGGNWGGGVSERELSVWFDFHIASAVLDTRVGSDPDGQIIGYAGAVE